MNTNNWRSKQNVEDSGEKQLLGASGTLQVQN